MEMTLPLAHLRVLDLSHHVAGPFCTRLLADWGAAVIKVERPGTGDAARHLPPLLPGGGSSLFAFLNGGKRSVALDLTRPEGRDAVLRLAEQSDLLVENFRPGWLDSVGLTDEAWRRANPRLVHVSITNFGRTGPYRDLKASEVVLMGMAGLPHTTGRADREPLAMPGHQAEYQGGLYAWAAAMAALRRRRRTGRGCLVDVSLLEAVVSNLETFTTLYSYMGMIRMRADSRHLFSYPMDIFPCKDGWVLVQIPPKPMEAVVALTGDVRLADAKFEDNRGRLEHREEFERYLGEWLMQHGRDEIVARAQECGLPFAHVATLAEVLEDRQLAWRQTFAARGDGTLAVAEPVLLDGRPLPAGQVPALGQHSRQVLLEVAGLTPAEYERLRTCGVTA